METKKDKLESEFCVEEFRILITLRLKLLARRLGRAEEPSVVAGSNVTQERPRLCAHQGGRVAQCWPGQDCGSVWRHVRPGLEFLLFTDSCQQESSSCWTNFLRRCRIGQPTQVKSSNSPGPAIVIGMSRGDLQTGWSV